MTLPSVLQPPRTSCSLMFSSVSSLKSNLRLYIDQEIYLMFRNPTCTVLIITIHAVMMLFSNTREYLSLICPFTPYSCIPHCLVLLSSPLFGIRQISLLLSSGNTSQNHMQMHCKVNSQIGHLAKDGGFHAVSESDSVRSELTHKPVDKLYWIRQLSP